MKEDYYEVLGLQKDAGDKDIKTIAQIFKEGGISLTRDIINNINFFIIKLLILKCYLLFFSKKFSLVLL